MPSNPFQRALQTNPTGLIRNWVAVTPNDSADNVGTGNVAIGLYVSVGGTISWVDYDGVTTGPVTVPNNFYINGAIARVRATGTTATGIYALISA